MSFRSITIRARLFVLLGLVLLTVALVGGIGYAGLSGLRDSMRSFAEHEYRNAIALGELREAMGNIRRYEKDVLINMQDKTAVERYRKEWVEEVEQTRKLIIGLGKTLDGKEELQKVKSLDERLNAYQEATKTVFDQVASGQLADITAVNKALDASKAQIRPAEQLRSEISAMIGNDGNAAAEAASVVANSQVAKMALTVVLALALLAPFILFSIRSVVQPLRKAIASAERIAAKDLSEVIRDSGQDEPAQMLSALIGMQEALRSALIEVRESVGSIGTASSEVAVGSQDLSQRTELTAANLEEAASSMEELTSTMKQSADSARSASQLAVSASETAARGGSVVAQVVATMDEINASSKRIADIISVIDGIAFQTNILALNAAVESARAGEHGRGFAVVAGEVRSLAQRSAEAAKEIKTLIGASVERVEIGARLVAQAGSTMGEVVSSVQRVTDMVGEITAATSEQSLGIAQVNESVARLDQMTQQNAALVEESAAAASSLQQQAQRLNQVVGLFKLGSATHSFG
nr:methyl-accepting chemotaxis protein [uncultured Roseateles sp.]